MLFIVLVLFSFLIGTILILLFGFGGNNNNRENGHRTENIRNNQAVSIDSRAIASVKLNKNFKHVNVVDIDIPTQIQNLISLAGVKSDGRSVLTISLEKEVFPGNESELNAFFDGILKPLSALCPIIILFKIVTPSTETTSTNTNNSTLELDFILKWFNQRSNQIIPSHRILFHETRIGKIAFLRQLKPVIHIEYDSIICSEVAPFMKVVLIKPPNANSNSSSASSHGQWKTFNSFQHILSSCD